jgi:hypothetical protein
VRSGPNSRPKGERWFGAEKEAIEADANQTTRGDFPSSGARRCVLDKREVDVLAMDER